MLESAFHQHWAADATLNALLPAERLKTGLVRGTDLPCASLVRKACRTAARTNAGGRFEEATIEVRIRHDDHDAGRAVADAAADAFDRARLAVSGGQNVLQTLRTRESVVQCDDGAWEFLIEFLVQLQQTGE